MPDATHSKPTPSKPEKPTGALAVKEGLTSVVIAFALAFVFRGFVLEAFLIPTGSMAPTLLGAHHRYLGPTTGYNWTTDQWRDTNSDVQIYDPMARAPRPTPAPRNSVPRRAGDRIFVLKYLKPFYNPERWDVSVFKFPPDPRTNYIKRLIGLPNEQVALIDGDVFTRPAPPSAEPGQLADGLTPPDTWNTDGWTIARKPERAQRAVWQDLWDSRFAPASAFDADRNRVFRRPWTLASGDEERVEDRGWDADAERVYTYDGGAPATMVWSGPAITDDTPYNLTSMRQRPGVFPVSDVATLVNIEPRDAAMTRVEATLSAHRHLFRALIESGVARLQMRAFDSAPEWTTLAEGDLPEGALEPGRTTTIEFWRHDQRLTLWIDGERVATGDYDWTPVERVRHTFAIDLTDPETLEQIDVRTGDSRGGRIFVDTGRIAPTELGWKFEGAPFTLHRSVVKRDLHYQPGFHGSNQGPHSRLGQPTLGTHPCQTPTLGPDQFLLLGDNSPVSADGRVWDHASPWVEDEIDSTIGVVHRDLMIGRAFIVYFPAPKALPKQIGGRRLLPDAGRLRWIF